MSTKSRNTTGYDVQKHIKQIKEVGITKYYFSDLPESLKNISLHNAAAMTGVIQKTGKQKRVNRNWVYEWEVI